MEVMTKLRIAVLFSTLIIVAIFGTIAILYARGFRLEQGTDSLTLSPKGLLVVNSEPTGAQIIIDDELKNATNNTVTLDPGAHKVVVKKEGFQEWAKDVVIVKEEVTVVNAFLLPTAPSLTAFTFSGAINPSVSDDISKIIYVVPAQSAADKKAGLWIVDTSNLPLGFSRDPRQITDGDLADAIIEWSPDAREILVTLKTSYYKLSTGSFTEFRNVAPLTVAAKDTLKLEWSQKRIEKTSAQLASLPDALKETLTKHTKHISFSLDEERILYTASGSATLPESIGKAYPGASTQTQTRTLKDGETYVYDIKEDRNFLVGNPGETLYWVPNSLNLIIPEKEKISVIDYDNTNRKTVYTGNYIFPHAYPSTTTGRLLILTNFGAETATPNLYWLSLK